MGVAYPAGAIVVPLGPEKPQPLPSRRTDLGCKGVADERFGGFGEGSQNAIFLQMAGSAYGIRTRVTAVRGRPRQSCMVTGSPKKSLMSREIVRPSSRAATTNPNEDHAVGLQKGRRRAARLPPSPTSNAASICRHEAA